MINPPCWFCLKEMKNSDMGTFTCYHRDHKIMIEIIPGLSNNFDIRLDINEKIFMQEFDGTSYYVHDWDDPSQDFNLEEKFFLSSHSLEEINQIAELLMVFK